MKDVVKKDLPEISGGVRDGCIPTPPFPGTGGESYPSNPTIPTYDSPAQPDA